jgi:hypothetical protein
VFGASQDAKMKSDPNNRGEKNVRGAPTTKEIK